MMNIHIKLVFLFLIFVGFCCAGLQPNPKYHNGRAPAKTEPADRGPLRLEISYSEFRRRLSQEVESYLGVPYRWGGTTRSGLDCSGFVSVVYLNATKLELPRKARAMFKFGRSISARELKFGDLVFFERIENDGISHVGIYLDRRQFAHASTSEGVVISTLDDVYYNSRFVGARRIFQY